MNKRVYGLIGIKAELANWNADFSGAPKSTSDGAYYGSDKALKYPMKKMFESNGEKVMYMKSMILDGDNYRPRTLKEKYEDYFGDLLKADKKKKIKGTSKKEILENLFNCLDIKQFGSTFAEDGNNFSITGAVQISQGFNKYDGMETETQNILSPFARIKDEEETNQASLGTKVMANEAHYFYHFVVNPKAYSEYEKLGVTEGYTEDDYKKFKESAIISATSFNTNSKTGCENEFSMFIETEEETYLPDLANFISISDLDGKKREIKLDLDILEKLEDKIQKIEIFYNNYLLTLTGVIPSKTQFFNIFTKEKLEG